MTSDAATSVTAMRELYPGRAGDVDPLALYPRDTRPRPDGRPWIMMNMITSLDGGTAAGDGLSGGLGGPGDRRVFRAVRASCDWIVVAAGTARAERYRRPRVDAEVARARAAAGRRAVPRLAVVTARGDLDPDADLFSPAPEGEDPVTVVAGRDADAGRLAALADRAEIVRLAVPRPAPRDIVEALDRRGADIVLVEGGPGFNGPFVADDLVDELCWSIAPVMVAGPSARLAHGPPVDEPHRFELTRLLMDTDGTLFTRYVRRR